ncbi:MAG: tRNA lysidine(34) synthetase TilS [Parachlamydiales bacterium]|jgi:tRNA(Ile)-lysidine synthase
MHLADTLHHFLFKYGLIRSKVLLAVSGGPDSMAMLHAFHSKHRFPGLEVGVAHVDHCWRSESTQEALTLEKIVKAKNLDWHLKTLDPSLMQGNLEEACREARLNFFAEVCQKYGYAGVLLAHHADDQAETVLKRVFEGASLLSSKGMQEKSTYQGLVLYRPFLKLTKKNILDYIQAQSIQAFDDPTNYSEKYTRAKMRSALIPQLSNYFGKEIAPPLARLGETLNELEDFISTQLPPVEKGWCGWMVDCNNRAQLHPFVLKHILYALFRNQDFAVPSVLMEGIVIDLKGNAANKSYVIGQTTLYVDRGYIFALQVSDQKSERLPLKLGENHWGEWKITLERNISGARNHSGWKNLWKGEVSVQVPDSEYFAGLGDSHATLIPRNKELGHWWSDSKVPAFLRQLIPVIWDKDAVTAEFLGPPLINDKLPLLITLSRE